MRATLLCLLLLMPGLAAAAVTLETRGQADLLAQREATDAALSDLRAQAMALHVTESVTLTTWLASKPVEAVAVEQALRDAEVVRDESADGRWHRTVRLQVGDIESALEGTLRRGFVEEETATLTGRGSADVPAVGTEIDSAGFTPQNP